MTPPGDTYERLSDVAVRPVDASGLAVPGSRTGSTTLLYEETNGGSQVAAKLYSAEAVARLLVHEQAHVFQIDQHANQPAYDWSVYIDNYSWLKKGFAEDPRSAAPYFEYDPAKPLAGLGLPQETADWNADDWNSFTTHVQTRLGHYAYRYLPTEIQAYNIELDAARFFSKPEFKAEAERELDAIWETLFPGEENP